MALEYKRRDITVDDYHRMADAGIFAPDERVELIDGELIEMAPLGLGEPNDVGYAASRELSYGDTFSLAAVPDVVLAADPFLDPRGTP